MTRLVVTLGMHRAGTSAITRGMTVLGASLGHSLIPPQEKNNPRGFWEDKDLNTLDSEILGFLRHEWHYVSQIGKSDLDALRHSRFAQRAEALIKRKSSGVELLGLKDPRMLKLLPFWEHVFDRCGASVNYIVAIRHPLSVATSLEKRNGFPVEKSVLIWAGSVIKSMIHAQCGQKIVVDYDRLLTSPRHELQRIASRFSLEIDSREMDIYSSEFIESGLRHSRYSESDLMGSTLCPPLVKEIYVSLAEVAQDKVRLDDPALLKRVRSWAQEYERMGVLLELIDRVNAKNVLHVPSAAWRDFEVSRLTAELEALYSSRSWQITKPFRSTRNWLRDRFIL